MGRGLKDCLPDYARAGANVGEKNPVSWFFFASEVSV